MVSIQHLAEIIVVFGCGERPKTGCSRNGVHVSDGYQFFIMASAPSPSPLANPEK